MKIGYWDAFSGISGDMAIGSLVDAGASFEDLARELDSLGTGARFRLERTRRRGLAAARFTVDCEPQNKHRRLLQILEMIERSSLPAEVKQNAADVFRRLAQAEAKVHGTTVDQVHFHEVGAVDSICDVAGACLGLHSLGVKELYCSPLNLGSGTVKTEHGILPVPAPATAELLNDKPVYASGPAAELTTPTGAALAATLAKEFGPMPPMKILGAGYGAGDKDFAGQANVLRFTLGETSQAAESTVVTLIEANLDDCPPQVLGHAFEQLFAAGALDVSLEPLLMKKNRQGSLLRVMATPETQEKLADLIFAETSTLGLRMYRAERRVLERRTVEVETPHGKVRIKVAANGSFAPEYEDCRRLALEAGVPLRQILSEANLAWLKNTR
ncbi:MAG: nickel pincer cofactor biosynthesis protein LarC [Acidobacteria bacterium]|nr:nickel pincer cofactor biosynthesis protein LarC [Acidobacteriota bacterium]